MNEYYDTDKYNSTKIYYDEMGRESECIKIGASNGGKDIATLTEYDVFGRITKKWLPGVTQYSNGSYVEPSELQGNSISTNSDNDPYCKNVYEDSPLNRIVDKFNVGEDWQNKNKAVSTTYLFNTPDNPKLNVIHFIIKMSQWNDWKPIIKNSGNYQSGIYDVTINEDEDGKQTYIFKNSNGDIVLSRKVDGNILYDTYYIYDECNNLLCVLPPKASDKIKDEGSILDCSVELGGLAYVYYYDYRNRCNAKRLPGENGMYLYIYDKSDQVILTHNPSFSGWQFSISDSWGRICLLGLMGGSVESVPGSLYNIDNTVLATRQNLGLYKGYSISNFSLSNYKILDVAYYDNYSFLNEDIYPNNLKSTFSIKPSFDANKGNETPFGLKTGELIGVLNDSTVTEYLYNTQYYDYKNNPLIIYQSNRVGGCDANYITYDYNGNILTKKHVNTSSDNDQISENYVYSYDRYSRLLTETHQINSQPIIYLAENEYDDLGRFSSYNIGKLMANSNSQYLNTKYTYNVRSIVTSIWSDWVSDNSLRTNKFNESLYYNNIRNGSSYACWNGNISSIEWGFGDKYADGSYVRRSYDYSYDALNRITQTKYAKGNNDLNLYDTHYSYDKMGNIEYIGRNNKEPSSGEAHMIDDVNLTYDDNHLLGYQDTGFESSSRDIVLKNNSTGETQYKYDNSGNMIANTNKGIIKINYNILNLPEKIYFKDGNFIKYIYDIKGKKLSVEYATLKYNISIPSSGIMNSDISSADVSDYKLQRINDYVQNLVFYRSSLSTDKGSKIDKLITDGAKVTNVLGSSPRYFYDIKDNLGDIRVVCDQDQVYEQHNYYPYGGTFEENSKGNFGYLFNGKEFDHTNGLDLYDYGARFYDPALGRFSTMDPLAEGDYSESPYAYCANNPIKYIDPDGNKRHNWIVLYNPYNPANDARYISAFHRENFYDESVVNIWAHGHQDSNRHKAWGIQVASNINVTHGKTYDYRNHDDVESFAHRIDTDDNGWKKRGKGHPVVVLHSCSTSQFAQGISASEEFKDVIIIAPDATLYSSSKGEHIGDISTGKDWKQNKEGAWHVYMDGKTLKDKNGIPITYGADEQPGSKGFNYKY